MERPGAQRVPFRHNGTQSSDTYNARMMINPIKKMRLREGTVGGQIIVPQIYPAPIPGTSQCYLIQKKGVCSL